jgi:hypothetical protein
MILSESLLNNGHLIIFPLAEISCHDMISGLSDQVQVKSQVLHAGDSKTQDLFASDKVPQVSFTVIIAHRALDSVIDGRKIIFPSFIVNIDHSFGCKEHGIPSIPRGHDTVKHIDPQRNCFQNIPWSANTHQVTRFIPGQQIAT